MQDIQENIDVGNFIENNRHLDNTNFDISSLFTIILVGAVLIFLGRLIYVFIKAYKSGSEDVMESNDDATEVSLKNEIKKSNKKICENCKSENEIDAKFCKNCGKKL